MAANKDDERKYERMPRGAKMPGQKLDAKVLKRVLSYLLRFKGRVILAVICVIGGAVGGVIAALSLGLLIDDCITPMLQTGFQVKTLVSFLIRMAAIFIVSIACNYGSNRIFGVLCQDIMREIRDDLFDHMQTLPIKYFDTHTHGKIMSHYTNDTETLRQLLAQTIPQIISASITLVVSFVSMAMTSVWLLLYVLLFVALLSLLTGKLGGISGRYFIRQQDRIASLNGFIEEMISGQRVVKVFNHEKASLEKFTEENENLFNVASKANGVAGTMGPIMNNMGNLMYVILAVIGALMITFHAPNLTFTGITVLTVGNIVSFLSLSKNFSQTVANIAQQMNSVVMAMAGAKRIFDLMDTKEEVNEGKTVLVNVKEDKNGGLTECEELTHIWAWKSTDEKGETVLTKLCGDVRLSHVNFGYTEEKEVLHDITLYAKPGQKVAFVGSTGAGKTTITNLINRFYDIQSGEITYDGIPITQIEKSALRSSLGIVLQDVNLFTGTIRENIRYGKLSATDEDVIKAARLANAHDFITRLPDGYDTVIDGTGSQLSQGQRQLISIARAAIYDPPVMILDEATSSIDTRTEAIVQRGMDALMKGRTVFVIAHRLSTVQNSDVIMVLEHGKIIERGSHEELIAEKGKYYQLYTGAFELD